MRANSSRHWDALLSDSVAVIAMPEERAINDRYKVFKYISFCRLYLPRHTLVTLVTHTNNSCFCSTVLEIPSNFRQWGVLTVDMSAKVLWSEHFKTFRLCPRALFGKRSTVTFFGTPCTRRRFCIFWPCDRDIYSRNMCA